MIGRASQAELSGGDWREGVARGGGRLLQRPAARIDASRAREQRQDALQPPGAAPPCGGK